MADPFDEFEFKPLTEGLGFHKKSERSGEKMSVSTASIAASLTSDMPTPRPATRATDLPKLEIPKYESAETDLRTPSQSISELIASLPPSLDFLEGKDDLSKTPVASAAASVAASGATSRPQIFQPLGRDEFKADHKASTISSNPTVGHVLPTPGTKAGAPTMNMTAASTSMAAATIAAPMAPTMKAPAAKTAPTATAQAAATAKAPSYGSRIGESFMRAFPRAEQATAKTTKTLKAKATPSVATAHEQASLEAVSSGLPAAVVDGMVVLGLSAIMLVCILAITHINLLGLLSNAQTDGMTQFHLSLLTLAVLQIYMLITRSFFGVTLGEWAFDLQLGTDALQKKAWYPLQVAWRSLVTTLTGVVVLPILSYFARRDIGAYISGLQLYRRS